MLRTSGICSISLYTNIVAHCEGSISEQMLQGIECDLNMSPLAGLQIGHVSFPLCPLTSDTRVTFEAYFTLVAKQ